MMHLLLQSPAPAAEAFTADTLVAKGAQLVETIKTTPASELMQSSASAVVKFGLKLLLAVVIYFVGAWLIRKVKKMIAKAFAKKNPDATIASFVQSLVTATLWVVLILAMVGTLGINTTSIAALLAAGGMAIGMAMSGTVQNFAGGLILLAFKPFKVGDFIDAQGIFGRVSEISIVHTKIVTTDNREITIPNGELANGNIDNYSSRNPHRLSLKFNVPYGTDIDELRAILLELVKEQPKILNEDTPRRQEAQGLSGRAAGQLHPDQAPRLAAGQGLQESPALAQRADLQGTPQARHQVPVPAAGHSYEEGRVINSSYFYSGRT